MSKVVELVISDSFSGIAEFLEEGKRHILVQWVVAEPCYGSQLYSKDIYTKPSLYQKDSIRYMSKSDETDIEKLRQQAIEENKEIFEKYESLVRRVAYAKG